MVRTHDRIRGVPGNWERLWNASGSLSSKINTRISLSSNGISCLRREYTEIEELAEYMGKLPTRWFSTSTSFAARRSWATRSNRFRPIVASDVFLRCEIDEALWRFDVCCDEASKALHQERRHTLVPSLPLPHSAANFNATTAWPLPCTAGENNSRIDYNGDVRACEVREKFATLLIYDYDFGALGGSGASVRERRQ